MVAADAVPYLTPLEGDPDRLTDTSTHYLSVADQIRSVSDRLAALVDQDTSVGESADALRGQAQEVADAVDSVLPRYVTTALALKEYAVALVDAQSEANTALAQLDDARYDLWPLYDALREAKDEQMRLMWSSPSDLALSAVQSDIQQVKRRIAVKEAALDAAISKFAAAEQVRDDAASTAIALISPALSALDDSFFDKVGAFFDQVVSVLEAINDWIANVLEQVLQWVSDLVLVVLALVFILVAFLLYSIPALLGVMTWDEVLDAGIGATMIVVTAFAAILVPALWFEVGSETPPVRMTRITLEDGTVDPYRQTFLDAEAVDHDGRADKTVIRVIKVGTDDNGRPIWRVVLPSTQDWEVGGDSGAANDLGSNLALMLTPTEKAAYERMVLQTMADAGIGPEDPVMLVGFSQGGILAGKLAADKDLPYNVEAIIVAGAPIDAMNIPSSVDVVALQHRGDPVHRLDGTAPPPTRPNWVTIETPTWSGTTVPASIPFIDPHTHDAKEYATTAQKLSDGSLVTGGYITPEAQAAFEAIRINHAKFFGADEQHQTWEGSE